MTRTELQLKSSQQASTDFSTILCKENNDPLVLVEPSDRLIVEPIWKYSKDDLEAGLYRGYIAQNPAYSGIYTRSEVAARLEQASKYLPNNYKLIIRASHRPLQVQLDLLHALMREYQAANPDKSIQEVLEYARIYVSDPAIKIPPHCCGAAVDVDMLDTTTGKLVDFGCPMNTDGEISFLFSGATTKTQKTNRMILLDSMTNAGFASYYAEWWHYSYGDQLWAQFYDKDSAIYGIVEPEL
jgi:D-alanyl-D-alanine dipeptidase